MLWHLAHIGAFEEWWLLIRLQHQPPLVPRYQILFDPIRTPREESEDLPERTEVENYLAKIRSQVEDHYLASSRNSSEGLDEDDTLHLVLEHEYQHQETLAYLLQMLPHDSKQKPDVAYPPQAVPIAAGPPMVKVEGGCFSLGGRGPFVYDNEEPVHSVDLADFRIDRLPVTNGEFLEFIGAGGYQDAALWSEAGWAWKEENQATCPLYWKRGETWQTDEMFAVHAIRPDHPVTCVSWYEAEAFSRFAGKRLPTEAEWEKAAALDAGTSRKLRFPWGDQAPDSTLCNFAGSRLGTTPVGSFPHGASPPGCLDMAGNVWEWTATTFAPYPGFKAHPYPEYSELWFDGDHRVLKGGSWMTKAPLLRASFRNFFRPGFRFAFAGFRCCS